MHVPFDDRGHKTGNKDATHAARAEQASASRPNTKLPNPDLMTAKTVVPIKGIEWRAWLADSRVKRKLINIISDVMPEVVRPYLCVGQEFIVASVFDQPEFKDRARVVSRVAPTEYRDWPDDAYLGNHAEADTRVWLHARVSPCSVITIYSPDTDITMVGLLTYHGWRERGLGPEKQVYVQIRRPDGKDNLVPDVVDINLLARELEALEPLQPIPQDKRVESVVALFVWAGCDFTSFFYKLPHVKVFDNLCKEALFVSGQEGHTLADWPRHKPADEQEGGTPTAESGDHQEGVQEVPLECRPTLCAFLKLVGSCYFYKYKARFLDPSAARSFSSFCKAQDTNLEAIENWLEHLREQTWAAVPTKDECLPSFGALYFHFLRGLFALKMWQQACNGVIRVPAITAHGYQHTVDGVLQLVYDYSKRIEPIKEQVAAVQKGCGCKVTACKNRQCKCRAAGQLCTASCRCAACLNTTLAPRIAEETEQTSPGQHNSNSIQPTILEASEEPADLQVPIEQDIGDGGSDQGDCDELEEVDEWQDWDEHLAEEELEEATEQGALNQEEAEEDGDGSDAVSDSELGHDDDEGDDGGE